MDGLSALIARQRAGWSLEQPFYLDPAIYAAERAGLFAHQWVVMAHASELPKRGSHVARSLFGHDIVIVNAGDAGIRAYHNVCTHRGSRLCKEDGRAPLLVCPYHAWSFRLTGELQTIRDLPDDADPMQLGLRPVACRTVAGLVFCGLDEEALPPIERLEEALATAMRHHGIDRARIAVRRSYPTAANWKLALENFFECYHCKPSHPEYFRMNGHVQATAQSDPAAAERWKVDAQAWRNDEGANDRNWNLRENGGPDRVGYSLYRQPIGLQRATASRDGTPVAPLMGRMRDYDGGETAFHFGRFAFAGAYNDHVALFQFMPTGPESTDVTLTWLVDAEADLAEIDTDALTFMWDVTTQQDKRIVEENAAGVRSIAYRPGPYMPLEAQTAAFVEQYLAELGTAIGDDGPGTKIGPSSRSHLQA